MLYVYGGIAVTPEHVEVVTERANAFVAACLAESGVVEYALSWSTADPSYLRMLEIWESVDDHRTHTGQAHVAEWTAFISAHAAAAPTFHRYVVDVVERP
ncbi:putative quinol monooxygenase [Microbacterium sp. ZXX196]|uniref:putative quinol monooxygenase n=1 Tax=Microbacterium sp. ZXX196 TaxID=2609291 RepID=UPI0012B7429C|nr:antibiotic biosynthesis monooxygenase [Microbacterium sp. ZXX196]MTE24243.1 hypothetical protein [Microbacterium sp. ZXX196]